jgi:hypothetical protein
MKPTVFDATRVDAVPPDKESGSSRQLKAVSPIILADFKKPHRRFKIGLKHFPASSIIMLSFNHAS